MNPIDQLERPAVIVAADVTSHSRRTVSLAVQIAASTNSPLRGLFVLDEDLLQLTTLPVTREISLMSARERPTDLEQMQRALRIAAREFKKSLQQQAAASQLSWSFDTVHGRMRDIGLKAGADVAYIILEQPPARHLATRPERRPRRVLLVANESLHQQHALEVVMAQFDHQNVELTLVAADNHNALKAAVRQSSEVLSGQVKLIESGVESVFEKLARSAAAFDCAILSQHESPEFLLRILKQLDCPVILVA